MRTSLDLCVCLLTLCGLTLGPNGLGVKVVVEEGSDAVLPCSLNTTEDITGKVFFWKKDGQKVVFFYDSGIHHNNGLTGQDEQFKGRVSHFQDQLTNGNASIKINKTKVTDSGIYSCDFPYLQPRQTFNIELVVGASPKPHITTLDVTEDRSLLQCEVQGAFPKPKVEWQDRAGNILPAEEPQVSESGCRYYITLNTTVNKTGCYRCVATQEDINHQIYAETFVPFRDDLSRKGEQWRSTTILLAALVAVLLLVVALMRCRCGSEVKKPCHMSDDPDDPDDPDDLEMVFLDVPEEDSSDVSPPDVPEEDSSDVPEIVMTDPHPRIMPPPDVPEIVMSDLRILVSRFL